MLVEKYKPKSLREVLGQRDLILKLSDWLVKWKPGKALLIYGPSGTGKTLVVNLIAKEKNMDLFDINASDSRSATSIKEILLPASKEGSLFKKRLILIDEADGFGESDRGGMAEIIKIIKESANPIVLIANDAYHPKLRSLRACCELIRVRRIPVNTIEKKLAEIAYNEKIKIDIETVRRIAESSNGNIRSAINDLVTRTETFRDREKNIFDVLHDVFRGKDLKTSLRAIDSSDKDLDEIFWWIEQNIPLEYQDPKPVADAFEVLSKADMFRGKVMRNQNYRFMRYMRNMMASIALIENPQKRFILYRPPQRLITLGSTKVSRKETEEFYKSLGINCSMRKIKEQMPYLNMIMKK